MQTTNCSVVSPLAQPTPIPSLDEGVGEHEPFQISYIYLSTAGLLVTLIVANLLSLCFAPPSEEQRYRELYSRLIWTSQRDRLVTRKSSSAYEKE